MHNSGWLTHIDSYNLVMCVIPSLPLSLPPSPPPFKSRFAGKCDFVTRSLPKANVKNQRGGRGGSFASARLCLRMVNRKKVKLF